MIIGLAVVAAVGVAVPAPASAAVCAQWDPPDTAAVGRPASISFRTYAPLSTDGGDYALDTQPFPDYPFRVQAVSPNRTVVKVEMRPTSTNESRWSGRFTPEQAGSWVLHIVNLEDADAACYADVRLVISAARSSFVATYALIGLVTIAAIGALAVLRRRRVLSRPVEGK